MTDTTTKPLFLVLKTAHFRAFEARVKTTEFRKFGARWNAQTCRIGRPVVIALGYTKTRLHGHIVGFRVSADPTHTAEWRDCYGPSRPGQRAACISIAIEPKT
jgi:hypothetical protein